MLMTNLETDYRMAGIGELLWDILPDGKQMGGSPMNVVYHCQASGIQSVVISAVGNDSLGDEIIKQVKVGGNSPDFIQISKDKPTGTVSVSLNKGIPDFNIHKDVAWDKLEWNDSLKELAGSLDAVAFGSLAQRDPVSRDTIKKFIREMRPDSIRVFDINLRQDYHSKELIKQALEMANVLKINDEEMPVLTEYFNLEGSVYDQIKLLIKLFNLDLVAFTKGSQGSVLYSQELTSIRSSSKVEVKDTVGAGDTFTGVLISGLLNKKPLEVIHMEASEKAAWVCSQQGGTPPYMTKEKT